MPHELLLHPYRCADGIQLRPIGVSERVGSDMADTCFLNRSGQRLPNAGVVQGLPAEFDGVQVGRLASSN